MKNKSQLFFLCLSFLAYAGSALANDWRTRALTDTEALATRIELLDELAHDLYKEESTITKIHHFEETVLDFIDELRAGVSFDEASQEFSHVGQDLIVIYKALKSEGMLNNLELLERWNSTARAFSKLSRVFYCRD